MTLDANGEFNIFLIATDNSAMSPAGWTYQVQESLSAVVPASAAITTYTGPPPPAQTRTYNILLPSNPGAVDISQIAPRSPYSGQYLPVPGPPGPPGPPTTVNGHSGQSITLTYTDVTADPAGAATNAQAAAQAYTDSRITSEVARANAAYLLSTDPAVTNSRPPTGPSSGDLEGSYPAPSVSKIQGVAVSGTAAAGDVLTAGGPASAAWSQLPSGTTTNPGLLQLDGTATDIAPLGVQAAGTVGRAADAGHVHAMPRLDQVLPPTAPVSLNSQRITTVSAGIASTDAAVVGQLPTPATSSTQGLVQLAGDLGGGTAADPQVTSTHLASALPIDQGGTGQASVPAAYNALAPETLCVASGAPATDAAAINTAISAVSAAGGGRVRLGNGAWVLSTSITPQSNVVLCGQPGTTVSINFSGDIVFGKTVAFTNFVIEDLTFLGPVSSSPTVPTRARTTSGAGAQTAVYLSGDLDLTGSGQAQLMNFTMRRCTVQNCSALPLRIGGVRGKVVVEDCSFINNQDVGFIYCQDVQFLGNYVYGSADNGVSISRGNSKVTCVGNTIDTVCYNGIWLSGFDDGSHSLTDIGPTYFSCTGNTVINVGFNGIMLDQAPSHGSVVGNTVDQGYYRGASDQPSDANGAGIYIGGYPTSARNAPTAYATDLVISSNTLYQCARAGVYLTGAQGVTIIGNQIFACGTEYLADGITAISSTDATNNVGILLDNTSTNTNIVVTNNNVFDMRATPYCNYALVPQSPPSTYTYWFNQMGAGLRNSYNLLEHDPNTREISSTVRFDANAKFAGGATAGTSGGTGTISGFDINGAAGSSRRHQILTGSVARWAAGGTGDAETGSNAGTNWVLNSYSDTGVFLFSPITVTRATGAVTLSTPLPIGSGGTGSATQNWVDLTSTQTVGGAKTFSSSPRLPGVLDSNGNTVLGITETSSAVNYMSVQNNSTGNRPALVAGGSDTNVGLTIKTQGTGALVYHPGSDSTTAVQLNNAAQTSTALSVDTSNVRVGIGKNGPGSTLDVAGTVTATGLALTTSPTSGYVATSDSAGNVTWQAAGVNGITPVHTGFTAFGTGGMINTLNVSSGTSVTMVAGTIYWAAVLIPFTVTLTGVMVSVGTTGGTDSWIGVLYNSTGSVVANSTLSGTTAGSANTKLKLPFTSTATVLGPAVYHIALQSNGTTAKFLAFGSGSEGFVTGSTTGVFGTLPTITPGTTYTAGTGPFANTY
ncbi:right-handed parallel beta-helix repeat-containing protein [Kitasatospora sp. NPDC052896]|uniref:right-handed parallel beta-helix repeat-containing protein n=1 Tax=Kitasatospora sp. NPDC052896 TaxID=3364061 RepID=UPI0037C92B82